MGGPVDRANTAKSYVIEPLDQIKKYTYAVQVFADSSIT